MKLPLGLTSHLSSPAGYPTLALHVIGSFVFVPSTIPMGNVNSGFVGLAVK